MSAPANAPNWMYLHARCHPSAGTWLRLGPNGAHVLECKECRRMITAFRTEAGHVENIQHEPGLTYEEAIEPFFAPEVGVVCHNCEAVFAFSPSVQLAVDSGWLQDQSKVWACPSCRSAGLLEVMDDIAARRREDEGGICGAMWDLKGELVDDQDADDAVTICRRPAGHERCDHEPI